MAVVLASYAKKANKEGEFSRKKRMNQKVNLASQNKNPKPPVKA